jgi:hypothetical protein
MRVAKFENEMLSQGQQVPPDIFEDVQVHLEIHGDWLKANKFTEDQQLYNNVYQHYMMTFQLMQQFMAPAMAEQGGQEPGQSPAGGQPPAQGGGGPGAV